MFSHTVGAPWNALWVHYVTPHHSYLTGKGGITRYLNDLRSSRRFAF